MLFEELAKNYLFKFILNVIYVRTIVLFKIIQIQAALPESTRVLSLHNGAKARTNTWYFSGVLLWLLNAAFLLWCELHSTIINCDDPKHTANTICNFHVASSKTFSSTQLMLNNVTSNSFLAENLKVSISFYTWKIKYIG